MRLPPRHRNGHPAGPDGHALAGMSSMSPDDVARLMLSLSAGGIEFVALEWDFPRFEMFPASADLNFFTIFRDPVERLLSNYAFDVTNRFTVSRTIWDYLRAPTIWQSDNYYTRFFSGLTAAEPVSADDVDYTVSVLTSHFKWASVGDDLLSFVRDDVGIPVRRLRRDNRTSPVLRFISRPHLEMSPADLAELQRRNEADYAVLRALSARQRTPVSDVGMPAGDRRAQ